MCVYVVCFVCVFVCLVECVECVFMRLCVLCMWLGVWCGFAVFVCGMFDFGVLFV